MAGHLGMTAATIDETMSAREFFKWVEYLEKHKTIAERNEIMLAQLTSLLHNINSKKSAPMIDFLISISDEDKRAYKDKKASDDLLSYMRSLNGSR